MDLLVIVDSMHSREFSYSSQEPLGVATWPCVHTVLAVGIFPRISPQENLHVLRFVKIRFGFRNDETHLPRDKTSAHGTLGAEIYWIAVL